MLRDVGEVFWWHICLPSRGREFDSPHPHMNEEIYCPDCQDPSLPWWARINGCTCGYVSNLITEQIENDPVEVEKLRRSRQQARDGYTTPLREAFGDDDGPGAT